MAHTESADAEDRPEDPVAVSHEYLYAVKTGGAYDDLVDRLASWDRADLLAALGTDGKRKAFWLNVYNAAVQHLLDEDPSRYENRRRFYSTDHVTVAGEDLSLDAIEHGILRAGQSSIGLGYVRKPDFLTPEFVRAARVERVDPRIHFALNCGAASCPPIAAYTAEGIEAELVLATESYLHGEVEYEPDRNRARVPRLMLWFRGDFGGRSGIYRMLREYGPIPESERPKVKYKSYDWSLSRGVYREED